MSVEKAIYKESEHFPGLEISYVQAQEFDFGKHYHSDYHIGLINHGGLNLFHRGATRLINQQTLALTNPDELHYGRDFSREGFELMVFGLAPKLMKSLQQQLETGPSSLYFQRPVAIADDLHYRLCQLHLLMQSNTSDALYLHEQWILIMSEVVSRWTDQNLVIKDYHLSHKTVDLLRDYCQGNIDQKISLLELSDLAGLNEYQFIRQFKKTMALTPYAWLIQLRLQNARKLLRSGALTVCDAAHRSGFYDQSHFCKTFKSAFGLSPSAFIPR